MSWVNITKYLDRFKDLKPPKQFVQDETTNVLQMVLEIPVDSKNIEYRGGVLYIKTENPAVKNHIFMHKEKILEELRKKLGNKSPKDVRF